MNLAIINQAEVDNSYVVVRAQLKRTETRLFLILTSKMGKHTRQGLKRKYEQMEWQNDEIRFSSNSGVFGVGFINLDKGGVLMTE